MLDQSYARAGLAKQIRVVENVTVRSTRQQLCQQHSTMDCSELQRLEIRFHQNRTKTPAAFELRSFCMISSEPNFLLIASRIVPSGGAASCKQYRIHRVERTLFTHAMNCVRLQATQAFVQHRKDTILEILLSNSASTAEDCVMRGIFYLLQCTIEPGRYLVVNWHSSAGIKFGWDQLNWHYSTLCF